MGKKVKKQLTTTRKGKNVGATTAGVEIDPFEADLGEQVLRRRDQSVFTMDASSVMTRSELTSATDSSGGKASRITWRSPLCYSKNAAGTTPIQDARGLVTDVYGGTVKFANLTNQAFRIKINTPKGHLLLNSLYKVASRDGDAELRVGPHATVVYRYSFKQNSTAVKPYFNKVQTKKDDVYTPHMVLADFAVIAPDINEDTGTAFPSTMEVMEVTVAHNYSAGTGWSPGSTHVDAPQMAVLKLSNIASMYKVDAVLETTNGQGANAPMAGYQMVTVDPLRHRAIGYRFLLNGQPFTAEDDVLRAEGDVVTCQLSVTNGHRSQPAQIEEFSTITARLTTTFGPVTMPNANWDFHAGLPRWCEWRYETESGSFMLWDPLKQMPAVMPWPDLKEWHGCAHDAPIIAYKSDTLLAADVHLSFASVLAVLEAASAIIGIIKRLSEKSRK